MHFYQKKNTIKWLKFYNDFGVDNYDDYNNEHSVYVVAFVV